MTTRTPHLHPSERGAIAIEFATLRHHPRDPRLGCIGVAMGFYTYEVVNEYARDASRYAMVHGNGCSIPPGTTSCSIGTGGAAQLPHLKTYLNNQIFPGINGKNLKVTTSYARAPALPPATPPPATAPAIRSLSPSNTPTSTTSRSSPRTSSP